MPLTPLRFRLNEDEYRVLALLSEEAADSQPTPAILLRHDVDHETKCRLELRGFVEWVRPTPHKFSARNAHRDPHGRRLGAFRITSDGRAALGYNNWPRRALARVVSSGPSWVVILVTNALTALITILLSNWLGRT